MYDKKTATAKAILIVVYLPVSWSYINFVFSTASGKYWRGSQERDLEGRLDSFYSYSSPKSSWEMEVYAPRFVRMPNRLACVHITKSLPLTPLMISQDLEPHNKPVAGLNAAWSSPASTTHCFSTARRVTHWSSQSQCGFPSAKAKARQLDQASNLIRISIEQHILSVCLRRTNSISQVKRRAYHELQSRKTHRAAFCESLALLAGSSNNTSCNSSKEVCNGWIVTGTWRENVARLIYLCFAWASMNIFSVFHCWENKFPPACWEALLLICWVGCLYECNK